MSDYDLLDTLQIHFAAQVLKANIKQLPSANERRKAYNQLLKQFKEQYKTELESLAKNYQPYQEIPLEKLELIAGGVEVPMVDLEKLNQILGKASKNPFF